jgi:hypothetical protein
MILDLDRSSARLVIAEVLWISQLAGNVPGRALNNL